MTSNLMNRVLAAFFLIGGVDLLATLPAPTPPYTVGQYAEGGVIFWLKPDGIHGLVVSIADMEDDTLSLITTFPWAVSLTSEAIGATGSDLSFGPAFMTTTGRKNSALITNQFGAYSPTNSYAAGICAAYSYTDSYEDTYADWYLPTLAELGVMMSMTNVITNTLETGNPEGGAIPGYNLLQTGPYWSSFESLAGNTAWIQNFYDASQDTEYQLSSHRVRAVRAF